MSEVNSEGSWLPSPELSILMGNTMTRRATRGELTICHRKLHTASAPFVSGGGFTSFCYLLLGILIGEAKDGTARASVLAGPHYWPQRLSDRLCRHKLSHQAFMAKLVEVALACL
jgi:hypothetical protein